MNEFHMCPKYEKLATFLGKRWTGLILRVLLEGECRFSEVLENVNGLSSRLLTEPSLRIAGDIYEPSLARVDDRRSLLGARASGVEGGHSMMVAFGLGSAGLDFGKSEALRQLHADQVWVVVDASRKQADTERWVSGVKEAVTVDGVVAFGRELTATPESVSELGLPVRWQ